MLGDKCLDDGLTIFFCYFFFKLVYHIYNTNWAFSNWTETIRLVKVPQTHTHTQYEKKNTQVIKLSYFYDVCA